MDSLEISYIGSACGKNIYEPRNKTIMLLLCREYPKLYRDKMIKNGNIRPLEGMSLKRPIEDSYKIYSNSVDDPKDFNSIEKKVINEIKTKTVGITDSEIETAQHIIRDSLKKDCGKNTEKYVIQNSDRDMIVEIKTRMKKENIRKNEYDLYQLFGYMLVMGKTRGMISQTYSGETYNSTIENECEYGIIDTNEDKWNEKYINFYKELNDFFKDVNMYSTRDFDISNVMKNGKIYAEYDIHGKFHNVDPKYINIFKALC